MKTPKVTVDRVHIENATSRHNNYIKDFEKFYFQITTDPDSGRRHEQSYCKYCWYRTTISGQAFTSRPCGLCDKEIICGNTNVGVLCSECAKENKLCQHCGGDVDGKNRRKRKCYDNKTNL